MAGVVSSIEKQHEIPNDTILNAIFDDIFSAVHMSPLIFSFLTIEYPVDYLNSNVHPFETNDLLFGACSMIPNVIVTFMRPKLQHHYSHFITHVYETMRKNALKVQRIAGTRKAIQAEMMILPITWTLGCQALPELRMSVCQGTSEQWHKTSERKDVQGYQFIMY